MYKVLIRSNKPKAQPLQDHICEEILPSIRRHGGYHVNPEIQRQIEELQATNLALQTTNLRLKDTVRRTRTRKFYSILNHELKFQIRTKFSQTAIIKQAGL